MFVNYDAENPPLRQHPWTKVEANPEARYWNFLAHPDQIPLVLEDFKPWAHYAAIPRFYELLTWLNGNDSIFESNDCGLRPSKQDNEAPDLIRHLFTSDPIVLHGRLAFIFRDLTWNTSTPNIDGLKKSIHDGLRDKPMAKASTKRGNTATSKPKAQKKMLMLVGAYESEQESDDIIAGRRSKAHSLGSMLGLGRKEIAIDLEDAKRQWEEGLETVQALIEVSAAKTVGGWHLDEVSVGMTLTAKGKLAFIAEAGVEASIHFVFKQKS